MLFKEFLPIMLPVLLQASKLQAPGLEKKPQSSLQHAGSRQLRHIGLHNKT